MKIRAYRESDFEMICSWWEDHNQIPPSRGMMIEDGTFILELFGKAAMTLTVFKTQSKEMSYFEGYCKHPLIPKIISNEISKVLWEHCLNYLRDNGYKRVLIFTDKPALVNRYQKLGMIENIGGITALGRLL